MHAKREITSEEMRHRSLRAMALILAFTNAMLGGLWLVERDWMFLTMAVVFGAFWTSIFTHHAHEIAKIAGKAEAEGGGEGDALH